MLVDREEVEIYERGTDEESHDKTQNRLWLLMFEDDDKVKIYEQSRDAPFLVTRILSCHSREYLMSLVRWDCPSQFF